MQISLGFLSMKIYMRGALRCNTCTIWFLDIRISTGSALWYTYTIITYVVVVVTVKQCDKCANVSNLLPVSDFSQSINSALLENISRHLQR